MKFMKTKIYVCSHVCILLKVGIHTESLQQQFVQGNKNIVRQLSRHLGVTVYFSHHFCSIRIFRPKKFITTPCNTGFMKVILHTFFVSSTGSTSTAHHPFIIADCCEFTWKTKVEQRKIQACAKIKSINLYSTYPFFFWGGEQ